MERCAFALSSTFLCPHQGDREQCDVDPHLCPLAEPQAEDNDEDGGGFYHEDIQREEDRKRWERNAQQEIVNGTTHTRTHTHAHHRTHARTHTTAHACLTWKVVRYNR
jgi:hypothetical protein